jgi:two-component system cell cycle sensor histidine kinase/response regulator CckA
MLHSAALEAAANAIVITDKQGKIIWTNQSLTDITGYTREEAIGQNPQILKSGLHNEHFYANLWDTILAGKIWHGEIINRRKDTRLYTEEMTITPVRNSTGEIEHFVAIKRDITERKRLQQNIEQMNLELAANTHKLEHTLLEMASKNKQLQEAQNQLIQSEKLAAIGVLSSGIAHEIKNPLAIISLSIEEFESLSDKLDAQSKSYIQMIKSAAERANNVIIELLRFARVSDLKAEVINLFSLVEGTFVLLHNSSKFKGITLEHKYTNTNICINGDRILLEQVLFNLLINAVDESPNGATVTVKTSLAENFKSTHKKKQVLIEVIDTGKGIDPEILPKIFEPFFTTKEQGKGTGLGLSTVYTLLKRHNGTIDVESTVGSGTKFTITLPCADENPNITNGG